MEQVIAVGVIAALASLVGGLSVRAMLRSNNRFLNHIEKKDVQFTTFLENHMSANTAAQQASARASERVADRLERLESVVMQPTRVRVVNAEEVDVAHPQ